MRGRFRHAASVLVASAASAVAAAALLVAGEAAAQRPGSTDASRARDAFERGSAAYRLGDYARAAAEYARADALDPNPAALRAALDAATLADDPVLGEELIERAEHMPGDAPGARTLDAARARFAHRTGRVVVRCPAGRACLATMDSVAFDPSQPKIVVAGLHTVAVQSDGAPEPHIINVAADAVVEVVARPPAPASPPPSAPSSPAPASSPPLLATPGPASAPHETRSTGLPPVVFFVALGVTVVAGGVTTWSALDTRSQHATFDGQCTTHPTASCESLQSQGESAQTRTNVLLAVSGALAVTTATLGLLVHWGGPRGETIALAANGAGGALRVGF
jgi:hypothetical protein